MEQHHIGIAQQMFCVLIIGHTLYEEQGALRVDDAKDSVNAQLAIAQAGIEGKTPRFDVIVAHEYLVEWLKHERLVYEVALKAAFNAHRFAIVTEDKVGEDGVEFGD